MGRPDTKAVPQAPCGRCWEHRHSLLVPQRQPGLQPLPDRPASSVHERKVLSVGANVAPPAPPSSEVLLGPPPVCGAKESPLWFGMNFQAYLQGRRWGLERGSLLGAAFGLTFLPGAWSSVLTRAGPPGRLRRLPRLSGNVRSKWKSIPVRRRDTGHRWSNTEVSSLLKRLLPNCPPYAPTGMFSKILVFQRWSYWFPTTSHSRSPCIL